MNEANEMMVLKPEEVVDTVDSMLLITKETFDKFIVLLAHWYKEESLQEDNIPNIFYIFQMHDPIIDDLSSIFIESLGWRELGESQMSYNFERNPEDEGVMRNKFIHGYDAMFLNQMINDVETAFEAMRFVYRWDSTEDGGTDQIIKGSVVLGVW